NPNQESNSRFHGDDLSDAVAPPRACFSWPQGRSMLAMETPSHDSSAAARLLLRGGMVGCGSCLCGGLPVVGPALVSLFLFVPVCLPIDWLKRFLGGQNHGRDL